MMKSLLVLILVPPFTSHNNKWYILQDSMVKIQKESRIRYRF